MKRNKHLFEFILGTIWWFILAVSAFILMQCALQVGGALNIAAGIVILVAGSADILLGIVGIVAYCAGRKDAFEEIYSIRANVCNEDLDAYYKAGKESVEIKKEENKNENE